MSTNEEPLISVIIPNYNNEKYLRACVDSLLNQTYSNVEIVVVDDCSTDNSWELLNILNGEIDNLVIYKNEINQGVSYSRNKGVSISRGEYITTLDPDDMFYPMKIQAEYNVFLKHNNNDIVVYSSFTRVTNDLIPLKKVINKDNALEGDIYRGMLYRAIPFSRDVMIKKRMFELTGGFNECLHLYEDWDFKLRLAKQYKYYFSGVDGIMYRQHCAGLSSVSFNKHIVAMRKIFLTNSPNGKLFLFNLINQRSFYNKVLRKILFVSKLNRFI